MQAGTLNERVYFLKPEIIKTETGSEMNDYVLDFTCKANVKTETGTKENLNGDIAYIHIVTFQVRKFYKFNELYRIEWNGRKYMIISIDKDRLRQHISIKTELIND